MGVRGGRVWLLQARPMTALPPPPIKLNAAQRRLGSVLLDYIPVRPYPIDMSTWVPYGPAGLMAGVTGRFGFRDAFEGFLPRMSTEWSTGSSRRTAPNGRRVACAVAHRDPGPPPRSPPLEG